MEEITVYRALRELKTIESRIDKKIQRFIPVGMMVGGKFPESPGFSEEKFAEDAQANFQSIKALIDRRKKIKSAIVQSNAETGVTVAGILMTVAEAIERKNSIALEKKFYQSMATNYKLCVENITRHNDVVRTKLDNFLPTMLKKEASKIKGDEFDAIAVPYMAANEATFIDPLGLRDVIQNLEQAIDLFEEDVDVVLSESNAQTLITI